MSIGALRRAAREQAGPGVAVSALGVALAAALSLPDIGAVQHPWGQQCTLAWCETAVTPPAEAVDGIDRALSQAARLAALSAGRDCTAADAWAETHTDDELPSRMIVRAGTGMLRDLPWQMPAPDAAWTLRLCA
ncbi:MAG: hypothetical protein ACRDWY_07305 [Actinomycetes bacterium]